MGANGVSLFFAISGFLILLPASGSTGDVRSHQPDGLLPSPGLPYPPAAMVYLLFTLLLWLCLASSSSILGSGGRPALFWAKHCRRIGFTMAGADTPSITGRSPSKNISIFCGPHARLSGNPRALRLAILLAGLVAVWRWWNLHHQWVATLLPGLLFYGRTDVRLDGLLLGCAVALFLDDPVWRRRAERHFTLLPWFLCVIAYTLFTIVPQAHPYTVWESMLLPVIVAGTVIHPVSWIGGQSSGLHSSVNVFT